MAVPENINQENLLSKIPDEVLLPFDNLTHKEKQIMMTFWDNNIKNQERSGWVPNQYYNVDNRS